MKKNIAVSFFLVVSIGNLLAQTLTIQIENTVPGNGALMVGVYNDEGSYPDTYFRGEEVIVTDGVMIITITGLPRGTYAVAVYQDKEQFNNNMNKSLR